MIGVDNLPRITGGDFFAGGGGMTRAMHLTEGLDCKWVLNHNPTAIKTNTFHHKNVTHFISDFYQQQASDMERVNFAHASIECDTHTIASGGKVKDIGSYTQCWEFVRYIAAHRYDMIGIENVPEFKKLCPIRLSEDKELSTDEYSTLMVDDKGHYVAIHDKKQQGVAFLRWKKTIMDMGYEYTERICNAADYGIPQRRVRLFIFFFKKSLDMQIEWPMPTHNKNGSGGLKKWEACKNYIDLNNEGQSIFGRAYNENIPKNLRRPLCDNTHIRIAGGIEKLDPDMFFIMQYYGTGTNVQTIEKPINTIPTKSRHALVKLEKLHFVQDYCRQSIYTGSDEPISPQLTWQTKQSIMVEFNQVKDAQITIEKRQFITKFFNSNGNPQYNNHSLYEPIGSATCDKKNALITAIANGNLDFDIKMRFLDRAEVGRLSSFPEGYFSHPDLKLNEKQAFEMIGNSVPPDWGATMISNAVLSLRKALAKQQLNAA